MNCYRCGDSGHYAADCPLAIPAMGMEEHLARIDQTVDLWISGEITLQRKRQLIAEENRLHYGEECRPALLRIH